MTAIMEPSGHHHHQQTTGAKCIQYTIQFYSAEFNNK